MNVHAFSILMVSWIFLSVKSFRYTAHRGVIFLKAIPHKCGRTMMRAFCRPMQKQKVKVAYGQPGFCMPQMTETGTVSMLPHLCGDALSHTAFSFSVSSFGIFKSRR